MVQVKWSLVPQRVDGIGVVKNLGQVTRDGVVCLGLVKVY